MFTLLKIPNKMSYRVAAGQESLLNYSTSKKVALSGQEVALYLWYVDFMPNLQKLVSSIRRYLASKIKLNAKYN